MTRRLASAAKALVATTLAAGLIGGIGACAPRLGSLSGELAPVVVPRTELPVGHRQIAFDWEYADPEMIGRGEGVVRIASPDSARLDLFLAGGFGSAAAVLIGDSLDTPGIELMRRVVPPSTLLWGALGRVRLPVTRDTVVRRDGAVLRADVGRPVAWRATFRGDTLLRLEHVEGDRIVEWVDHGPDNRVEYRQESAHRTLKLHITRVENVTAFDPTIWHIAH